MGNKSIEIFKFSTFQELFYFSILSKPARRLSPLQAAGVFKIGSIKIISEVAENNSEYIIMKNNQPTAVLISVKEYNEIQEKLAKLERFLEDIEDIRLLNLANERMKNPNITWTSFEDLVAEAGFTMEEIEELAESVEIE